MTRVAMTGTWYVYDGAVLHGPYVFRSDAVEAAKHLLRYGHHHGVQPFLFEYSTATDAKERSMQRKISGFDVPGVRKVPSAYACSRRAVFAGAGAAALAAGIANTASAATEDTAKPAGDIW